MADYFFISQLPSLDGVGENTPLPITEERFLELCRRYLGKRALEDVDGMTLQPPAEGGNGTSPVLAAWNRGERELRLALGKARAVKRNVAFPWESLRNDPELTKTAAQAVELDNPMEAERYLFRYRLGYLETLRPMDTFSRDYIYYYGLKLKLLERMQQFDTAQGEAAYRTIYHSILHGERLEVTE